MKKHLPNLLTIFNLLSGVIAIFLATDYRLVPAALFIFLAALFDFFDGAVARWLKVSSEIGKQLDSLADMVTFGTAPAFIVFQLLKDSGATSVEASVVLLIPAFSALRLAKFNIDERQLTSFIGLPTPANGFFWAGLAFIEPAIFYSHYVIMALVVIMSLLLVAELPMFSLKFSNLKWRGNQLRFFFLTLSAVLIMMLFLKAIPIIVFLYIIFSIINNLVAKKNEIQS